MKKMLASMVSTMILMPLLLVSCRSEPRSSVGGLRILASTSFLADIAQNVAGAGGKVESLLPVGADPHAYQAAPADVAKITESTVLILNGIEYEKFIEPLLENAGGEPLIIFASDGLVPTSTQEDGTKIGDPHMWLDPHRVVKYVENIRDGLIEADPGGAKFYQVNADAYILQLKALDAWISDQVQSVPPDHRLLVTNHEALGYFAERYGFSIVATVLPSVSTDAGTSAQELAAVIDQVKASGAPAIFLGEVESPDLANQIAAETGAKVVRDLYLESLTDGEPAGTYIDMMKYNVARIVDALK